MKDKINMLLHRIKYGDKSKRNDLFMETYQVLKEIAEKYSSDKKDLEDITAEAYVKVLKHINKFDGQKDGYNWLCKIVKNTACKFNCHLKSLVSIEELKGRAECCFETEVEAKNIISNEIARLSPYEQNLIYLRFWDDLTYDQMAEKLNGKKSTIYKQVTAIIKKMNGNIGSLK